MVKLLKKISYTELLFLASISIFCVSFKYFPIGIVALSFAACIALVPIALNTHKFKNLSKSKAILILITVIVLPFQMFFNYSIPEGLIVFFLAINTGWVVYQEVKYAQITKFNAILGALFLVFFLKDYEFVAVNGASFLSLSYHLILLYSLHVAIFLLRAFELKLAIAIIFTTLLVPIIFAFVFGNEYWFFFRAVTLGVYMVIKTFISSEKTTTASAQPVSVTVPSLRNVVIEKKYDVANS